MKGLNRSIVGALALVTSTAGAQPLQAIEGPLGHRARGISKNIPGDVDGDGFVDVVMACADHIDVYSGGPDGPSLDVLSSVPLVRYGDIVYDVQGGDLNGDGFADVVVHLMDWGTDVSTVEVRYGSPSGISDTADVVLEGGLGLAVADIDADGWTDLVVGYPEVNGGMGQIALHLGGPGGISGVPDQAIDGIVAGGFLGQELTTGDVNGDGHADIVTRYVDFILAPPQLLLFFGTPAGLAPAPMRFDTGPVYSWWDEWSWQAPGSVAVADLNGDGFGDILEAHGAVLRGRLGGVGPVIGDSRRWVGSPSLGNYPSVRTLGDVNGSGTDAVVFGSEEALDVVWRDASQHRATLPMANGLVHQCASADVDGDGLHDILCGGQLGPSYFAYGSPAGPALGDALVFPTGYEASLGMPMSVGDVDGDGYDDLASVGAWEDDQESVRVFLGSALGFSEEADATWPGIHRAAAGDFDGDGLSDVAVLVDEDQDYVEQAVVHYGDPLGPAVGRSTELAPASVLDTSGLLAGDVDGDGYDDLVLTTDADGLVVFHGSAAGLAPIPVVLGPPSRVPRALADVDGDGLDDLVAFETAARPTGGYRTEVLAAAGDPAGLQPFSSVIAFNHTYVSAPTDVATGDWDGDGHADLLLSGGLDLDEAMLLFGSPTGLDAATATSLVEGEGEVTVTTKQGDLTGDGIDDLLVKDADGIRLYEGRAAGFGTVAPSQLSSLCGTDIEVVDLYGDGVPELATLCEGPLYNGLIEIHAF